ncbi:MAG: hypothetical protein RL463_288, partial [Bacteroidota bacterium]
PFSHSKWNCLEEHWLIRRGGGLGEKLEDKNIKLNITITKNNTTYPYPGWIIHLSDSGMFSQLPQPQLLSR